MRIRIRIVLVVVAAAIIPVMVSAWTTLGVHQEAMERQGKELRMTASHLAAELVQSEVDGAIEALTGLVGSIDWAGLSDDEREGALWLIFGQSEDIGTVLLIDADGQRYGPVANYAGEDNNFDWGKHPKYSPQDFDDFAKGVRDTLRPDEAVVISQPIMLSGKTALPVSFSIPGAGRSSWLAVAFSLEPLCQRFDDRRPSKTEAYLLDSVGGSICPQQHYSDQVRLAIVSSGSGELQFSSGENMEMVAGIAVNALGWRAVISQPLALAQAPQKEIRQRSLYWIGVGLLGAFLAGIYLAGGVAKPVESLKKAAEAVQKGDYEQRISVQSNDEIGALGLAFNSMSEELKRWNGELHNRVESRTAELRSAQEELLEARKMSGLASLTSGVAHEINNPLTGVLTLAQAMLRKAKKGESVRDPEATLGSIVREAQRIARIVAEMALLDEASSDGHIDSSVYSIINNAVKNSGPVLEKSKAEIKIEVDDSDSLVFGNAAQLTMVLSKIVDNGIQSMQSDKGVLTIRTRVVDQQLVVIEVEDTGCGIPRELYSKVFEPFFSTKINWEGTGMGLALAHQIVHAHKGKIAIQSELGIGTTISITLPLASKRSHLA